MTPKCAICGGEIIPCIDDGLPFDHHPEKRGVCCVCQYDLEIEVNDVQGSNSNWELRKPEPEP